MTPILSPLSRRSVLTAALGGSAALALASCGGNSEDSGGAAAGTEIVVAAPGVPTSWAHDSGVASNAKYDFLCALNGFLLRNPYVDSGDGKTLVQDLYSFEGDLAESYDTSEDGLTYTFHLRTDVTSPAGNPLTADDVLWSYERKWATPTSSASFVNRPVLTDPARQIVKIDDHTVSFTVDLPGYGFTLLALLANSTGGIWDSVLLQANATPEDPYAVTWSDTNPTAGWGFGAWKLDSVDGDQQAVLVPNEGYPGSSSDLTKITYRAIPDAGTRSTALKTGEVQVAMNLRPVDSADLLTAGNVTVPDGDWSNQLLLAPLVTNKAPFDDVAVRQAFAYAIDYDQIISSVYHDRAVRATSYLDTDFPSYVADGLPEYDYDPAKAKQLLTAAGFADGVEFTLTYPTGTPDIADAAVQIQNFAKDAGFTVTLDEQALAAFTQGRANGEYQAMLLRDQAIVMSPAYEMGLFTGRGATTNYPKWEDDAYYALVDAAVAAGDPTSEAGGLAWNAAEVYLLDQAPLIYIARPKANWAVAGTLQGAAFRTDSIIDYSNVSTS